MSSIRSAASSELAQDLGQRGSCSRISGGSCGATCSMSAVASRERLRAGWRARPRPAASVFRAGPTSVVSDVVDRVGDLGLELLRPSASGLLGLLLELGRLRLRRGRTSTLASATASSTARFARSRSARKPSIRSSASDDDVGRVVEVDPDRLEQLDQRHETEQLRQGAAEELGRVELALGASRRRRRPSP